MMKGHRTVRETAMLKMISWSLELENQTEAGAFHQKGNSKTKYKMTSHCTPNITLLKPK